MARCSQARPDQEAATRKAEVYVEGRGRPSHTATYRPQFYFRTTDVTGAVKPQEGQEMVMPGDQLAEIEHQPIAMDQDLRRHPRGGGTVGGGVCRDPQLTTTE